MKYNIYISQFKKEQREEMVNAITSLGGIHNKHLQSTTNILICKNIHSKSYKSASILECEILLKNWLIDSMKNKKFISFDNYRLGIFEGLKVKLHGIKDKEDERELQEIFERYGGEITKNTKGEFFDIIFTSEEVFSKERLFLNEYKVPILSVEWLKLCLLEEKFLNTKVYDLRKRELKISRKCKFSI